MNKFNQILSMGLKNQQKVKVEEKVIKNQEKIKMNKKMKQNEKLL